MPPRGAKKQAVAAAAPAAAAHDADASGLTEYELQRLAHIRRNQEFMTRLGVLQARAVWAFALARVAQRTDVRLCAQSASALRPPDASEEAAPRRQRKRKEASTRRSCSTRWRAHALSSVAFACRLSTRQTVGAAAASPARPRSTRAQSWTRCRTPRTMRRVRVSVCASGALTPLSSQAKPPKRARRTAAERDAEARAVLEHSRRWLAESRAALQQARVCIRGACFPCTISRPRLPQLGAGAGAVPEAATEWRAEAVRRWGDGVVATLPSDDWRTFVTSRLTTPPPPSTSELLQEFYAHDAWQLLACCVLMSRVSSWAVKHNTIAAFFEQWPTPTALLAAAPDAVQRLLHPLGLFPARMQSLVAVSRRFLEAPVFSAGLAPENKIYGIGEFGVASFEIFCRGNLGITPSDATLKAFVAWQRRRAAKLAARQGDDCTAAGGAGDSSSSDGEEEDA